MDIIENLRDFQINKSLTSPELSKLLNVELDKLVKWYEGREHPDKSERYRIIKLMDGADIDDSLSENNRTTRFLND
ncbi:MAG: hypothetical protein ACOX3U_00990 [Christensenellales bacterium]|jgi:DNA-binding transcriptional regulator YiaG